MADEQLPPPKKLVRLPGFRLKMRTHNGQLSATVWREDDSGTPLEPIETIGIVLLSALDGPEGELFKGWLAAMEAIFVAFVEKVADVDVVAQREEPHYGGEIGAG